LDPTNEVLYSNRSAAYLSLGKQDGKFTDMAVADGRMCLELKPEWGKGYARLGAALFSARNYVEAAKVYATGVGKEPTNALLTEGLINAQKYLKMKREQEEEDEKRGHVIGIDLGTTFSAVGCWLGDRVVMIPNDRGEITTPSYVAFQEGDKRIIGMAAKAQAAKNPKTTVYDVKR
jgi:heat shock protein 1/8